jgi:hypothetical protein
LTALFVVEFSGVDLPSEIQVGWLVAGVLWAGVSYLPTLDPLFFLKMTTVRDILAHKSG